MKEQTEGLLRVRLGYFSKGEISLG
jgi:hypothetical protein